MTIWTDLQALIDAEVAAQGYTGTLAELGIGQPFIPSLGQLLKLQSDLAELSSFSFSATVLASANAGVIKASAGSVFSLLVVNRTTELRYFHLVDKNAVPTNADISLSQFPFAVPPNSTLAIGKSVFGDNGLPFASGIAWADSLTDTTITLGATTDLTVKVGYL